jgi:hypothetical protein
VAAGFDLGPSAAAAPDLSLSPSSGAATAALPSVVSAISDAATQAAARSRQAAAPEVRLATPASVGRGLRNDDISGFYLAVGALGALLVLGALFLRGGRRAVRAATAGSVLRLPGA